jgi:hypothetical protein
MPQTRPFKTMYPGYYQIAYVTNNRDLAMKQLGEAYGIQEWYTNPRFVCEILPEKTMEIRLALTFVGDTQIEVIEPIAGAVGFYRTVLTDDKSFQVKFHHVCVAFETAEQYEAKVAELRREGLDMPVDITREMKGPLGLACYADLRHKCGHYIEYVWLSEPARAMMDSVPRN